MALLVGLTLASIAIFFYTVASGGWHRHFTKLTGISASLSFLSIVEAFVLYYSPKVEDTKLAGVIIGVCGISTGAIFSVLVVGTLLTNIPERRKHVKKTR